MKQRTVVMVVAALVVTAVGASVYVWRRGAGETEERAVPISSVTRGKDDATLVVRYVAGTGGCGSPLGVTAEESVTSVRLVARVRFVRGVCPLVGRAAQAEVRLASPLAGRTVIDGSTSRRLAVELSPANPPNA